VLELGRLAQHVDQRLAVLDDKRCLGRREATARCYDLGQSPLSGCNDFSWAFALTEHDLPVGLGPASELQRGRRLRRDYATGDR
jgi:hypothetical protein